MFDYDQGAKNAVDTLDKYDFSSLLKPCHGVDIYDVGDWLKEYSDEVSEALKELSLYELTEYLHRRYGVMVEETSRYYIWWNDRHDI